ncbi:MAG: DNA polymerase III subunit beta [Candidatus Gastranaerophilales bacterium]
MKFIVRKEDLSNGIKITERATSAKALQPVLYNILIETIDKGTVRFVATDLDFTVIATVNAQVEREGSITLPAKKLNEIASKIGNELITFDKEEETNCVNITCQKTRFDLVGIPASEFPQEYLDIECGEEKSLEIEIRPFSKAVRQAGFAASSYDASNLLSGIVCDISNEVIEIASTDGNRLARMREKVAENDFEKSLLIVPSKTLNEFIKLSSLVSDETVNIYKLGTRIIFKTETTITTARLLEGVFPKYNQLIPQQTPKNVRVNISQFVSALERVAIMINEKTSIVKLEFCDNNLKLTGDSPDAGKSEENLDINYTDEALTIAFNYRFIVEALKNMECDEVDIGLNTPLSATMFTPINDEDFVCLVMPVQIR